MPLYVTVRAGPSPAASVPLLVVADQRLIQALVDELARLGSANADSDPEDSNRDTNAQRSTTSHHARLTPIALHHARHARHAHKSRPSGHLHHVRHPRPQIPVSPGEEG